MNAEQMQAVQEHKITYFHAARRYLKEHDPVRYWTVDVKEIERLAEVLRYEDFRRHIQPYLQQKERLLTDFYNLQTRPDAVQPLWLQDALAEWDGMIAIEARKFGYEPSAL